MTAFTDASTTKYTELMPDFLNDRYNKLETEVLAGFATSKRCSQRRSTKFTLTRRDCFKRIDRFHEIILNLVKERLAMNLMTLSFVDEYF
jgi:hypothetical protein